MAKNLLEQLLRKAGDDLANYQVARFWKFPEELQQTPCDFMGFTVTGRAILIEAKQVKRTSLPIGKAPGLAAHQYNALDEANRAGALALVCWAQGNRCATLSWDMVLSLSKGRRSIPWREIPNRYIRHFHPDIDPVLLLDRWLVISKARS